MGILNVLSSSEPVSSSKLLELWRHGYGGLGGMSEMRFNIHCKENDAGNTHSTTQPMGVSRQKPTSVGDNQSGICIDMICILRYTT